MFHGSPSIAPLHFNAETLRSKTRKCWNRFSAIRCRKWSDFLWIKTKMCKFRKRVACCVSQCKFSCKGRFPQTTQRNASHQIQHKSWSHVLRCVTLRCVVCENRPLKPQLWGVNSLRFRGLRSYRGILSRSGQYLKVYWTTKSVDIYRER